MSDDHSPGDRRQPYSDRGGPAGRHAETHDVRREQLTNPTGPESTDESFAQQLAQQTPAGISRDQVTETTPASEDKTVVDRLPQLNDADLSRLSVMEPGTQLEQGSVYLDLNNLGRGEFTAMGSQEAGAKERLIPKKGTDYELWNQLTADQAVSNRSNRSNE